MYLQLKNLHLTPTRDGKTDITVKMIGLYQDDGKRVKRIKLDQIALDMISTIRIPLGSDDMSEEIPTQSESLFSIPKDENNTIGGEN